MAIEISCGLDGVQKVSFTGQGTWLAVEAETFRTISELVGQIDGRLRNVHAKITSALEADEALAGQNGQAPQREVGVS